MPAQDRYNAIAGSLRICHSALYQEPIMPGKEDQDYQEWISAGERVHALALSPLKKNVMIAGLPDTGKKRLCAALALPEDECLVTIVQLTQTPMPAVISALREADVVVMTICCLAALSIDEKIFLENCFRLRRLQCVMIALTYADLLSYTDQQCVMETVALFVNKAKGPHVTTGIFFTEAYAHEKKHDPESFLHETRVQTGDDGTGISQLKNALIHQLSASQYPAAVLAASYQVRHCIMRRSSLMNKTIERAEKKVQELRDTMQIIKTQTGVLISRWEALFSQCAKEKYAEHRMNLSNVLRNIDDGWPAFSQNVRKLTAKEYLGYSLSTVIGMLPAQRAQEYAENRMRKYFEPLREEASAYFARQADTLKLLNEQSILRISRNISNSLQNTTTQFMEEFASMRSELYYEHNGSTAMLCAECDSLSLIDTWCYRLRAFSDYFNIDSGESGQEPVAIPLSDAIENQMRKVSDHILAPIEKELNAALQKFEKDILAGICSLASLSDVSSQLKQTDDRLCKTFAALFQAIYMTPPGDDVLCEYAQDCELSHSI